MGEQTRWTSSGPNDHRSASSAKAASAVAASHTPGPHALGPAGGPRGVVHRTGQGIRAPASTSGPSVQVGQVHRRRSTTRAGSASAISTSRSASVRVAFNSTGTTPIRSAPRTAHSSAADEGRQKATRSPGSRPEPPQGAGGPALGRLGRLGGQDLDGRRSAPGPVTGGLFEAVLARGGGDRPSGRRPTVAAVGVSQGGEDAGPRQDTTAAMQANRSTAPITVTARTPMWSATHPWTHRPDRVDDAQAHHVDAEHPPPDLGRGPELDHRVEPRQHGDVAGAHAEEGQRPTTRVWGPDP